MILLTTIQPAYLAIQYTFPTCTEEMGKETESVDNSSINVQDVSVSPVVPAEIKKPWWHPIIEPGSAAQIVIAAVLAIAIGLVVTSTVDSVPVGASTIIAIPGTTWLRALRATGEHTFLL